MDIESPSAHADGLDDLHAQGAEDLDAAGGFEGIARRAGEFIRERPIVALLFAAGAGFLLGRLLRA